MASKRTWKRAAQIWRRYFDRERDACERLRNEIAAWRARNEAVLRRDEHMHKVSAENDRLRGEVMDLRLRVITLTKEQAATHAAIRAFDAELRAVEFRFPAHVMRAYSALVALLAPAQRDTGDEADCVRDEP